MLLALVAGMEIGCRLAQAGTGRFSQRGFHPTGILGAFAATCVTAKLRGLSADELTSSLGLCGSQAAGILELKGSWLKRMHPGWAAHCGVVAATLGEAGYQGPATVFDGPGGLYRSHIEEIPDAEQLSLHTLGERWATLEIALKPYPCCHFIHAFADASLALLPDLAADHPDGRRTRRREDRTVKRVRGPVQHPLRRRPRALHPPSRSGQLLFRAAG